MKILHGREISLQNDAASRRVRRIDRGGPVPDIAAGMLSEGSRPGIDGHQTRTALLPIQERVLRPEHPDTLSTRDNLVRWTEGAKTAGPGAG